VLPLLDVKNLKTYFHTEEGIIRAVDGVDFAIEPEKTLGIVGESGCGKSVTALSILGLIASQGRVESGEILFYRNHEGVDLTKIRPNGNQMRSIRGNEIAMIFQEPMTSLNPVLTIGKQIIEAIVAHQKLTRRAARTKAIEMLHAVGIPSSKQRIKEYPHQLSGGMRQRAMIAMALCCNPSLLIADEPTTALDVTIQAQVLELMNDLRRDFKTAILFITHDLGVVAGMADHVAVMYLGKIVEIADVLNIFQNPRHPYTRGLINSIPSLTALTKKRLVPIEGVVPDLLYIQRGCGFEPRCLQAMGICSQQHPELKEIAKGHRVACWLIQDDSQVNLNGG
jgi:peptide/nickel transport system ATP-binding protein/oligopeptide transport system ATP-binding protein